MDYHNLCPGCMEERGASKICPHCGYDQTSGPASSHHLAPGTILHDKYLIGKVLGQGGFGITYLAWDVVLELKLAVKEFFPMGLVARSAGSTHVETYAGDQGEQFSFGLDRFLGEAKTLARFSEHPNIVTVRDFFKANNTAYMVMNHIEGLTLEDYLKQAGGKIAFPRVLEIMMPVMDALREVHEVGVMHRDISPDNVFIDSKGRVVLIDFGAARQEIRDQSKSLSVILKAGYAPEEQYRSKGKQGPWTDIYAVGATLYRCITGKTPPEAMDRLAEDDLFAPSDLGVKIDRGQEQVLLKALAVKAEDRFQTVKHFQSELVAPAAKGQLNEINFAAQLKEKANKLETAGKQAAPFLKEAPPYMISKKAVKAFVLTIICGLLLFVGISLFIRTSETETIIQPEMQETETAFQVVSDQGITNYGKESSHVVIDEPSQVNGVTLTSVLNVDYYIDYESGSIPISELPIGSRIIDLSWQWEHRTGNHYSRGANDLKKPVSWILVAKNHYEDIEQHVTLLTDELIALFVFDNSSNRGSEHGNNHWGNSGAPNATLGLRPWLNSSGIHENEGFYESMSDDFKALIITTKLPNREWQNGNLYHTYDKVFIPSATELGDTNHSFGYEIGEPFKYFTNADAKNRSAQLGGVNWFYWTRHPSTKENASRLRYVGSGSGGGDGANKEGFRAVRPALNLKANTKVSEVTN